MYYCVVVKTDNNLIATINYQLGSYKVMKDKRYFPSWFCHC